MNKDLGPNSRFGDGDGSFWDRWLTTTGYFTNEGTYAKAELPTRSMYARGAVRREPNTILQSIPFMHHLSGHVAAIC